MRISDWSSDVCSSDLFAAIECRMLIFLMLATHTCTRPPCSQPLASYPTKDTLLSLSQEHYLRCHFDCRNSTQPLISPQKRAHHRRFIIISDVALHFERFWSSNQRPISTDVH